MRGDFFDRPCTKSECQKGYPNKSASLLPLPQMKSCHFQVSWPLHPLWEGKGVRVQGHKGCEGCKGCEAQGLQGCKGCKGTRRVRVRGVRTTWWNYLIFGVIVEVLQMLHISTVFNWSSACARHSVRMSNWINSICGHRPDLRKVSPVPNRIMTREGSWKH